MSAEDDAPGLGDRWAVARTMTRQVVKAATAAEKALRAVKDPASDPVGALQAVQTLAHLAEAVSPLIGRYTGLQEDLEAARDTWRMGFLKAVKHQAERAELGFARLTTDELRIGAATVLLSLDKGKATVCYAREPLLELAADPQAMVNGVRQAMAELADGPFDAAQSFAELAGAYRALLGRRGLPMGERVPIVDLLPELLVARQTATFWKNQDPRKLVTVSRARLAWELDQLQKGRALEQDGWRVVLGTATGGTASKKQQVLFLESGPGGGQYYLSFMLKRVGAAHG